MEIGAKRRAREGAWILARAAGQKREDDFSGKMPELRKPQPPHRKTSKTAPKRRSK